MAWRGESRCLPALVLLIGMEVLCGLARTGRLLSAVDRHVVQCVLHVAMLLLEHAKEYLSIDDRRHGHLLVDLIEVAAFVGEHVSFIINFIS